MRSERAQCERGGAFSSCASLFPSSGGLLIQNCGKGKLIDIEVTVDQNLKGKSLQETVAHEGSHVRDDTNFLTSYDFATGRHHNEVRIMKPIVMTVLVLLIGAAVQTTTVGQEVHKGVDSQEPQITLCDLVARPNDYVGKPITVKAMLTQGMEYSIFTDDYCQPSPERTKLILAKFSSNQFGLPLGKKLHKLLKEKERAEVTVVGVFTDPGHFIGHQNCCRYELQVQRLLSVEESGTKTAK